MAFVAVHGKTIFSHAQANDCHKNVHSQSSQNGMATPQQWLILKSRGKKSQGKWNTDISHGTKDNGSGQKELNMSSMHLHAARIEV